MGETEEDYITEQIEYERNELLQKRTSELGLAGFRTAGVPHDTDQWYEQHQEYQAPERPTGGNIKGSRHLLRNRGAASCTF